MSADITKTDEVLLDMLRENTGMAGTAGGYYRPSWKANALRDIPLEPSATLDFAYRELTVRFNTFHWLRERVTYDERLDRIFQHYAGKRPDEPWVRVAETFVDWLSERCPEAEIGGIYGDGDPVTVYTYNDQNCLDQDIQFVYFEDKHGDGYALLQSHNGADARHGMSQARVFAVNTELGIFEYTSARIACDYTERKALLDARAKQLVIPGTSRPRGPDMHTWFSDDGGYRFHEESYPGDEPHVDLRDLPVIFAEDHERYDEDKDATPAGKFILVGADGKGKCPHCGCALDAYW
jgi:hypothetical protein